MGSKLKSVLKGLLLGSSICLGSFGGYLAYEQYTKLQEQEIKIDELESDKKNEKEKLEDLIKKQLKLEKKFNKSAEHLEQILGKDGLYDNNNVLVKDPNGIEKILDSICKIEAEARYKNKKTGVILTKTKIGSGTVIFGDYIMTANHVTDAPKKYFTDEFTATGLTRMEYTLQEIKYTISNRLGKTTTVNEVIYSDSETDSAFLKLPKDSEFYSFPFKLGNSLRLRTGNFVYSLGHSMDKGLAQKKE